MRYQRALHGIIFSIIVTASIFMGLSALSQNGTDQRASIGFQHETSPVTSANPSVPTWDKINHTMLNIDTQEAPAPFATVPAGVLGVSVPIATINRTFNKISSINATNTQPSMNLSYTDRYTIKCTNASVTSNFTVRLNTPMINATLLPGNESLVSNAKTIRITWDNGTNDVTYAFAFDFNIFKDPINETFYPYVTIFKYSGVNHFFEFCASNASKYLLNRTLVTDDSFAFEVNYTVPVTFSSWNIGTKTGESFRIEGDQSTRLSNYTVTFRVSGPKGVNITFHYLPADRSFTSNHKFYYKQGNIVFTPPVPTVDGWKIAPSGSIKLNSTGMPFKIDFSGNATVGFVEQKAGKWNSDGMSSRSDTRTRTFKLSVLSGASTLLVERVQFTANDIAYSSAFKITRYVTPSSSITLENDTYTVYDPIRQGEVTLSKGTKVIIGRIQGSNGTVTASFNYNASYAVTLKVRDEVRNSLSGAVVTLYFHGIRFGPLMSVNESSLQPTKISNSYGEVTFSYLPEGNYSVEVRFQDHFKTQEFSLYGGAKAVSIDVVTDVPYQPWILVTWLAIFGTLSVLGILLFKRKR